MNRLTTDNPNINMFLKFLDECRDHDATALYPFCLGVIKSIVAAKDRPPKTTLADVRQALEAFEIVMEKIKGATKKQIPRKPKIIGSPADYNERCPNCNERVDVFQDQRFCNNCGQALDWGDEK